MTLIKTILFLPPKPSSSCYKNTRQHAEQASPHLKQWLLFHFLCTWIQEEGSLQSELPFGQSLPPVSKRKFSYAQACSQARYCPPEVCDNTFSIKWRSEHKAATRCWQNKLRHKTSLLGSTETLGVFLKTHSFTFRVPPGAAGCWVFLV